MRTCAMCHDARPRPPCACLPLRPPRDCARRQRPSTQHHRPRNKTRARCRRVALLLTCAGMQHTLRGRLPPKASKLRGLAASTGARCVYSAAGAVASRAAPTAQHLAPILRPFACVSCSAAAHHQPPSTHRHARTPMQAGRHVHTYPHTHTRTHAHMYTYTCAHVHIHVHVHAHTHTHTHTTQIARMR